MHNIPQSNFQPTSLDFINRPNPVEPSAISHGHGHATSGNRRLEPHPNDGFLHSIARPRGSESSRTDTRQFSTGQPQLHASASGGSINPVATVLNADPETGISEPAMNRQRESDQNHRTLPLPSSQDLQRRHPQTVPPVLQGLHHPPPNAGILPSMNAEQSRRLQQTLTHRPQEHLALTAVNQDTPRTIVIKVPSNVIARPARRNKWTDDETHALLQGTRRFGVGNWKKILTCADYSFNHRTATDLKDRFRVVSSNKDMLMHYKIYEAVMKNKPDLSGASHLAAAAAESASTSQSPTSLPSDETADLDLPMPRAKRRQRTKWSEEEDDALLRGFGRYGPSWTSIQLDPVLKRRTPTDIRDRIRTRFSEQYTKAGLTPKPARPRVQIRSQPRPEMVEGSQAQQEQQMLPSLPELFSDLPGVDGSILSSE